VLGRRRRRDASRYARLNGNRDASPTQHSWTITCNLGGFGHLGVPWIGDDEVAVRDSFLAYLYDDASFSDVDERYRDYRSLYVRFNGSWKLLTFRTSWITGFTVH
jgi:hypothetical protein